MPPLTALVGPKPWACSGPVRGEPWPWGPVSLAPGGREGSSLPSAVTFEPRPVGHGPDREQVEPAQPRGGGERPGRVGEERSARGEREPAGPGAGTHLAGRLRVSRRLSRLHAPPTPHRRSARKRARPRPRPAPDQSPRAGLSGLRQALPARICLCPGRAATRTAGGRGPVQPARPLPHRLAAGTLAAKPCASSAPTLSPRWGQK